MKRIKVIGWIDVAKLPPDKVNLARHSGLTEQAEWGYTEGFYTFPTELMTDVWFKLENDDPIRTVPAHEVVEGDMVFEGEVTFTVKAVKRIEGTGRIHMLMTSDDIHEIWHSRELNEPIDICRRTEID